MDTTYYKRLAEIESSSNPLAQNPNSSAKGLFQFIDDTGAQYGLDQYEFGTPEYTRAEYDAVKKFTADNVGALSNKLGRDLSYGEMYLAHQQGASGANKLLSNPDARAIDLVGADQIKLNGGNQDMSAGEFADIWMSKFDQPMQGGQGGDTLSPDDMAALEAEFGGQKPPIELSAEDMAALEAEFGGQEAVNELSADDMAALEAEFGQEEPDTMGERINGFMTGAADSVTLGAGDEMRAGLQALIRGGIDPNVSISQAYDHFLGDYRNKQEERREDTPLSYGLGQVAGAFVPAAGALKAGNAASKALPSVEKLGKYARAHKFKAAAGIGAASGGIYGYNSGEGGAEERGQAALYSGAIGAAAGPVGARLGQAAGSLLDRAKKAFTKTPIVNKSIEEIAESAAVKNIGTKGEEKALNKVGRALKNDFGDDFENVLQAYKNSDASLADLQGARTRGLAKGAAQYSAGQEGAETFFNKEIASSPERALRSVDKNIGSGNNFYASVDDILAAGRKKASPLYDEAYEGVVNDKNILTVPEIQTALKKAYKQYPSELKDAAPDSPKALDYANRVLGDDISKAKRAGERNFARSRTTIKNNLLDAMDASNPAYKKARAASGDYLSLTNAMDRGKSFMKTDPELLTKEFKALSEAEKTAFRSGVGKHVRDLIEKTNEGANFYNRVLGSAEKQKRLAAVLSPKQYKRLQSDLKAEDRLFKLRNEVLGQSPTTSKAVAAMEVAGAGADMAALTSGGLASVPASAFRTAVKKVFDGINDNTAAQLSKIIYEKDPAKKLRIISSLSKNLTPDEANLAKSIYFESLEAIDPYRMIGAVATAPTSENIQNELRIDVRPDPTTQNFPDSE